MSPIGFSDCRPDSHLPQYSPCSTPRAQHQGSSSRPKSPVRGNRSCFLGRWSGPRLPKEPSSAGRYRRGQQVATPPGTCRSFLALTAASRCLPPWSPPPPEYRQRRPARNPRGARLSPLAGRSASSSSFVPIRRSARSGARSPRPGLGVSEPFAICVSSSCGCLAETRRRSCPASRTRAR